MDNEQGYFCLTWNNTKKENHSTATEKDFIKRAQANVGEGLGQEPFLQIVV